MMIRLHRVPSSIQDDSPCSDEEYLPEKEASPARAKSPAVTPRADPVAYRRPSGAVASVSLPDEVQRLSGSIGGNQRTLNDARPKLERVRTTLSSKQKELADRLCGRTWFGIGGAATVEDLTWNMVAANAPELTVVFAEWVVAKSEGTRLKKVVEESTTALARDEAQLAEVQRRIAEDEHQRRMSHISARAMMNDMARAQLTNI
jgi:hypothetical protein